MKNNFIDIKKRAENFYVLVKCLAQAEKEISLEQYLLTQNKDKFQSKLQSKILENPSFFYITKKSFNLQVIVEINSKKELQFIVNLDGTKNEPITELCKKIFNEESHNLSNIRYYDPLKEEDKNKLLWINFSIESK